MVCLWKIFAYCFHLVKVIMNINISWKISNNCNWAWKYHLEFAACICSLNFLNLIARMHHFTMSTYFSLVNIFSSFCITPWCWWRPRDWHKQLKNMYVWVSLRVTSNSIFIRRKCFLAIPKINVDNWYCFYTYLKSNL